MNSHVPCPKMFALCEDSEIIEPFYIMEFIKGKVIESILESGR